MIKGTIKHQLHVLSSEIKTSLLTFKKRTIKYLIAHGKFREKEQFVLSRVEVQQGSQNLMFLFTKGTNEQSVPFKITAREQFMNIWEKNIQVSHCSWEVPRNRTVCCQYSRMIKRFLKFNVPFLKTSE